MIKILWDTLSTSKRWSGGIRSSVDIDCCGFPSTLRGLLRKLGSISQNQFTVDSRAQRRLIVIRKPPANQNRITWSARLRGVTQSLRRVPTDYHPFSVLKTLDSSLRWWPARQTLDRGGRLYQVSNEALDGRPEQETTSTSTSSYSS